MIQHWGNPWLSSLTTFFVRLDFFQYWQRRDVICSKWEKSLTWWGCGGWDIAHSRILKFCLLSSFLYYLFMHKRTTATAPRCQRNKIFNFIFSILRFSHTHTNCATSTGARILSYNLFTFWGKWQNYMDPYNITTYSRRHQDCGHIIVFVVPLESLRGFFYYKFHNIISASCAVAYWKLNFAH